MKSNTLIQLPKFDYSSLDFETIIDDVKRIILEHPEYLNNWDDFLETDAGRMLLEMNAFIMEKFTSKLDWIAREMFIGTATQRQSQINILRLINYRPKLPTTAKASITATLTKWFPSFNLPNGFQLMGQDTSGQNIQFECIEMLDDGKPNYSFVYQVNTGNDTNRIKNIYNIPFYQGATRSDTDIYLDGISNEKFKLSSYPVIENSIRIYSDTTGMEFIEVESFISPEAQQTDIDQSLRRIPYMVKIDANNQAEIIFGHSNLVIIPQKGEKVRAIYRVGGGSKTNIVKGGINSTKTIIDQDGNRITIIFTNEQKAFGGSDGESIDEAKTTAPLSLRTANKTVTSEDYITHIEENGLVKHAKIVSKENEPKELYDEYGHFLPPLDTWIYVSPERAGLDEINPVDYNRKMQLSKPYINNGWVDYEDFEFTTLAQTVYLSKLIKYRFYPKHVVLYENTIEGVSGVCKHTYELDSDYTLDPVRSEISRIQTSDSGTIPTGNRKLRIFYLNNDTNADFENHCFRTFSNGKIILGDNASIPIYPAIPIVIMDKTMTKIYQADVDYTINYTNNTITLISGQALSEGETVFVTYADRWDSTGDCEEKTILDSIKNKKMLCIDNHIKDTRYGTFDLVATVYCYKNLKGQVKQSVPDFIKNQFNIDSSKYDYPISKAEIISLVMNQTGVRFVEVDYLGRDYASYRKYIQEELTLEQLKEQDADKVEHKIIPHYNEILTLSWDEYDGIEVQENQRHGLILKFEEA